MSTVNVTNSMTVASVNVDTTNQTVIGVNSSQNVATVNIEATNDVTVQISRTLIGTVANVLTANYANFAGEAFNVSGSNVSGYVANATHANISNSANSVSYANVVGLGNIATLNLDGNASNILFGNGVFSTGGGNANTGNVTFDNQIVIGTGDISGGSGLYLAPGSNSLANLQYLRVRGGDYITHIHFDTCNNQFYDQYFGDDNKYVKLEATGNIVINSNDYIGNTQQWDFGIDGNLTLPSNTSSINYANGSPYGGGGLGNLIVYGRTGGISISTVGGFIDVVGRTGNIHVYL